ncbi:MAG: hypothetical protein KUG82_07215 [Pseudomonadales bacterium]|nr:hypothetical protein [Pseudomonadales bacterium]
MNKWQTMTVIGMISVGIASVATPIAAYNGPDPDEGGIGGTGNIDDPSSGRPDIIERPERPERIEHIERPDMEDRSSSPTNFIDDVGSPEGATQNDAPKP